VEHILEGIFSLLFAKLAGKNGKVVAIEPEERNYKALEKMTKLNKDICFYYSS